MDTVIVTLKDGILKVADVPNDTRVVLRDSDGGIETTYKKEGGQGIFKKRKRI